MPIEKQKTILVTGSTDGIGKQTALQLSKLNARVVVHGRSQNKIEQTIYEIKQKNAKAEILDFVADFSSLEEVANLVEEIKEKELDVDVLINNAGVYSYNFRLSKDGYELTFAVNQLAPFLLTTLLLRTSNSKKPSRIITVASTSHNVSNFSFDDIHSESNYDGWRAYKLSKLANILFSYELSEKLSDSEVTSNCLHPGAVDTKMLNAIFPSMNGISPQRGAATSVYLATSDKVENVTGKYFVNSTQSQSSELSYDKKLQDEMWAYCLESVSKFL